MIDSRVVQLVLIVAVVTLRAAIAAEFTLPPAPASATTPTGADWEGYNKSLDGRRYSLLDQINVGNAASLAEVCWVRLATRGSFQSGLVVVGDALFATTSTETFAIDPVTCAMKWHHSYHRAQEQGLQGNRGVSYLNGRVFRGTDDGRLIALDAQTGELFVPVGNPVPDFSPMDRAGANLFTNSVLVLDAMSGALKWWYQLQANDGHDHDLAAAPVLFRNARHEDMVAAAGKDGLLHIIDRASHLNTGLKVSP